MIKIKTPKTNQFSFAGFESERISVAELLNILGGIERENAPDDITVKELTFDDVVFNHVIPVRNIENTQYKPYFRKREKKFFQKTTFFLQSGFFGLCCCTFAMDLRLNLSNK
ncbi:MAG: hypothetical protein LBC19_00605 [Tannerella sp.]|jgi:hypothetical protein|nr:hypothetical protein [Tannerella sp.]